MKLYTVKELSRLAGVSVRTLHHYDQIGLLKPLQRSGSAGYRRYGQKELLRLQQILFFKELDFPLPDIRRILDAPDFDPVEALRFHRKKLTERVERLKTLLRNIDNTMLKEAKGRMTCTLCWTENSVFIFSFQTNPVLW